MKFKNSFGVVSDSIPLLNAFAQEMVNIGWIDASSNDFESYSSLYFNGNAGNDSSLKEGEFWTANVSGNKYTLPEQWNEAITVGSEKIEERKVLFMTNNSDIYLLGIDEPIRDGDEYFRAFKGDVIFERAVSNANHIIVDSYVRFKKYEAAKDYCNLQEAIRDAGVNIGDRRMFNRKRYTIDPSMHLPTGSFSDMSNTYYIHRFLVYNNKYFAEVKSDVISSSYFFELADLKTNIKIGDYESLIEENRVHFGCQSFSKEDLIVVKRLLGVPIMGNIEIQGVKITSEMVNALLDKLN